MEKLTITEVPIADLKAAEYNPRKWSEADMLEMVKSISRFGFVQPVIANKAKGRENIVIGGHLRIEVAKHLGMQKVPVHFVDLDEAAEKELNLRLNKNGGKFDFDLLANHFDVSMLEDVGFSEKELGISFAALDDGIVPGDMPDVEEPIKSLGFKMPDSKRSITKHRLQAVALDNGLETKEDALFFLLDKYEKDKKPE